MKFFKIINLIIFISFFFFVLNFYFSKNFLEIKKKNRENYIVFLEGKLKKINTISSKKNFKEFQDNSEYFKKNTEEKQFWKLLKTK